MRPRQVAFAFLVSVPVLLSIGAIAEMAGIKPAVEITTSVTATSSGTRVEFTKSGGTLDLEFRIGSSDKQIPAAAWTASLDDSTSLSACVSPASTGGVTVELQVAGSACTGFHPFSWSPGRKLLLSAPTRVMLGGSDEGSVDWAINSTSIQETRIGARRRRIVGLGVLILAVIGALISAYTTLSKADDTPRGGLFERIRAAIVDDVVAAAGKDGPVVREMCADLLNRVPLQTIYSQPYLLNKSRVEKIRLVAVTAAGLGSRLNAARTMLAP